MSSTKAGNHLAGQIVRSGTSVALNYGEAQSGESRKDFIHKPNQFQDEKLILKAKDEANELISIFVKSVETAQKNLESK